MLKGKSYPYPNAIVDFNLKILDSNSFFNEFFKNKKDWEKLSVKITDLIEFDNLNEFKKSLNSIQSLENTNSIFNGKVKIGEKSESIKVTVNHIQNKNQKWSNQAVEIICQKIENLSDLSNYPKLILANSPLKIFTVDRQYNLTFFNKSAAPLLEFLLDDKPIIGEPFITQAKQKEEWKNYFDIIFSNEKLFLEKNYIKNNKEHHDLLTLSPLIDANGDIESCIIYGNDILELKKIELFHYQNHKKYQHLFENNFLGIGVLDMDSNLVQANDSFCRLAGIENYNLNQIRAFDFILGDDLKLILQAVKQIYKKEITNFTSELKFKNTDNEIKYAQVSLNGLYENNEFSGCLCSVVDISAQKEFQIKENFNLNHQKILQQELDFRIRELTFNQLLIVQKNNLINELSKKLEKMVRKKDHEIRPEIRKILSSMNRQNVFDDDWENLKIHFVKMHPGFFDKITARSPKITQNELRHCAYIKLGFSAKETSGLVGTLPRSIEQARFRIKKKLTLPIDQKLKDYLRSI